MCYEPEAIPDDVMCYLVMELPNDSTPAPDEDTIVVEKEKIKFTPPIIELIPDEPIIEPMCYKPIAPPIENPIMCYVPVAPPEQPEEKQVYSYVEQPPSFPDGDAALMKFINENLRYPVKLDDENIAGRVILRFIVRSTGEIDSIEVVKSITPEFDKEAIRVVESMPKWIPGKQNGEEVDVYHRIPVNIHWQ